MKLLRLLSALPLWLLGYAASLVLYLLGLLVVPLLLLFDAIEDQVVRDPTVPGGLWFRRHFSHRFGFPWCNEEDGVDGPYKSGSASTQRWIERWRNRPFWLRALVWSLLRNPVGNERRVPLLSFVNGGAYVEQLGNSANPHEDWKHGRKAGWYVCWARQGVYSGLWLLYGHGDETYSEARLGWGVVPAPLAGKDASAAMKLTFHWHRREPA